MHAPDVRASTGSADKHVVSSQPSIHASSLNHTNSVAQQTVTMTTNTVCTVTTTAPMVSIVDVTQALGQEAPTALMPQSTWQSQLPLTADTVKDNTIKVNLGANSLPIMSSGINQELHPIFQMSNLRSATSLQQLNTAEMYTTKEVYTMLHKVNATLNAVRADTMAIKHNQVQQRSKLDKLVAAQKVDREAITSVGEELDHYKDKVRLLTEAVSKLESKVERHDGKLLNIERNQNKNNLLIFGFSEEKNEDCTQKVKDFFKEKLQIPGELDIETVYRMGSFKKGSHRQLLVKFRKHADKSKVFANLKNLKGVKAETGKRFTIRDHLPEKEAEERKRFDQYKYINRRLPTNATKLELTFKKGKTLVNDVAVNCIGTPTTKELIALDHQDIQDLAEMQIVTGPSKTESKSTYRIFMAEPHGIDEISPMYQHMKIKFAESTHVSMAYRLPGDTFTDTQGYTDDGDYGNGRCMLNVLIDEDKYNVVLFLVRDFGNIHLGPSRFKLIADLVKEMLQWVDDGKVDSYLSFLPKPASCLPMCYANEPQNASVWSLSTDNSDKNGDPVEQW